MSSTIIGHGFTPEQVARGKRVLHRAETWRADNAQAWGCIVSHALDLAAKGQPIAAQALIESVRKKALVDRFGKDTRTNNSYAAIFARWLANERPETRQFIELRRSVYDVLIGGQHER